MKIIRCFTSAGFLLAFSACVLAQLDPTTGIVAGSNVSAENGAADVTLGDVTFVNHGLVGVGRIDANSLDAWGESLGSVSGLQLGNWTRTGPHAYTGSFYILPDRGYNSAPNFSNYAGRIQKIDFSFRPEKGASFKGPSVPQDQFTFSYDAAGSFKFTVETADGVSATTGLVPDSATLLGGKLVPFVTISNGTAAFPPGAGAVVVDKMSIDAEALVLLPDGSGYFGDEYGANIYHFNAAKQIDGVITPPPAVQPHLPFGNLRFSSEVSNVNGRRGNQGMEAIALSPDGKTLFGLMQSATIQDSGSGNQGRRQTRLLAYDISTDVIPATHAAEYVLTLPILNDAGVGAPNRTAAQSEIIALDNSRFLVLSRDGNGKGTATALAPVFKSVLLVDLAGATDISKLNGGAFDLEGGDITPAGTTLAAGIAPVRWVEAVNLLNSLQLSKFGLNLKSGATSDANSLSEKWEGMALAPVKEPGKGNQFFLFVANDNDFVSTATKMRSLDGSTVTTVDAVQENGVPVKNDTMFLVYRVTINGLTRTSE
ncbi:MAG: esterase-like activity of phytase family protein [Opitutaceae bacterium]